MEAGDGGGGTGATGATAAGRVLAVSRSRRTTRPPGPDPVSSFRSTPVSFAMRRANGEALTRVASGGVKGAARGTAPLSPLPATAAAAGRGAGPAVAPVASPGEIGRASCRERV